MAKRCPKYMNISPRGYICNTLSTFYKLPAPLVLFSSGRCYYSITGEAIVVVHFLNDIMHMFQLIYTSKFIIFRGSVCSDLGAATTFGSGDMRCSRGSQYGQTLLTGMDTLGRSRKPSRIESIASLYGSNLKVSSTLPDSMSPLMFTSRVGSVEGAPSDWTGSCILSLTKIPLPETRRTASMLERIKQEFSVLTQPPLPGEKLLVPQSKSLSEWRLCWRGETVEEDTVLITNLTAHSKAARRHTGLCRACVLLPKSMWDIINTMSDFSVLKSRQFAIICLANFIYQLGIYIPLFFVVGLIESFDIPKSFSSYLFTTYGATNTISRLIFCGISGRRGCSALTLSTGTMFFCGIVIALTPFCRTFSGQCLMIGLFGIFIAPSSALTSVLLCDIVGLDSLTNAYGIITLVRGVTLTMGSPLAGALMQASGGYVLPYLLAGLTLLTSSILYAIVLLWRHTNKSVSLNCITNHLTGPH